MAARPRKAGLYPLRQWGIKEASCAKSAVTDVVLGRATSTLQQPARNMAFIMMPCHNCLVEVPLSDHDLWLVGMGAFCTRNSIQTGIGARYIK